MSDDTCPCGSGVAFSLCCEPALNGSRPAPTAEALMRSRYTSFTRGDVDYLLRTRPGGVQPLERAELARWSRSVTWLDLTVHDTQRGRAEDQDGEVRFTARYFEKKALVSLRETSQFKRIDGEWMYSGGDAEVKEENPARNEPCPCGSGRKFKQCHA